MRATDLLQHHLQWINQSFHAVVDDMTDEEWVARPLAGMNLPGFTLWHAARSLDSIVQTFLRHVPEVITQPRWASSGSLATPGFGYEVTLEQADAIARGVKRADVSAYADAVLAEVLGWLATLSDDDLDSVPDWHAYIAEYPAYNVPAVVQLPAEAVWEELLGTCGLHVRGHLAEVALIKQQVRQAAATTTSATVRPALAAPAAPPATHSVAVAVVSQPAVPKRRGWPWGRR